MAGMEGRLVGVAMRVKSRAPMVELERAEITPEQGVAGDFRGRPGRRQVTVLSAEDWETACAVLGEQLPWTLRRANLLVAGITFHESTGSIVRIGDVALQVTGETDPCSRMDEAAPGLFGALRADWRGGVCCRVICGGTIAPPAKVTLETPPVQ